MITRFRFNKSPSLYNWSRCPRLEPAFSSIGSILVATPGHFDQFRFQHIDLLFIFLARFSENPGRLFLLSTEVSALSPLPDLSSFDLLADGSGFPPVGFWFILYAVFNTWARFFHPRPQNMKRLIFDRSGIYRLFLFVSVNNRGGTHFLSYER